MRNLLGRLNSRSAADLANIATAWSIPVSGGDKLGQVAQLYKGMTDIRTLRDVWAELPGDEQAMVGLLATGEERPRPLAELASELESNLGELRQVAVRLYHKGIVVREGDDDPLPVGEAPRLFMPRELSGGFRRVRAELAIGDMSSQTLPELLSRLNEREIEEAAETWGIRVIPGIRTRDEIVRHLLQQIADPGRFAAVERRLGRDARAIWELLRDRPGTTATLAEARAALELDNDDPAHDQRFRNALGELEDAVLVVHTYREEGTRWLFVPSEILSPSGFTIVEQPPPTPVEAPEVEIKWRNPDAVAWDLLSLLRALAPPDDGRIDDVTTAPVTWQRRLNATLWNHGGAVPPPGYLEFLIELARVEALVTGGDAAVEEPFKISSDFRSWRNRTFPEQTAVLRSTWLSSTAWIEGSSREDVDVWGADWPGLRLKLLTHLSALQPSAPYVLEQLSNWLAMRDPDMLGGTFTLATARATRVSSDDAASRRAAVAEVVTTALVTGFSWFGIVDIARGPGGQQLLLLTPFGNALARNREPEPRAQDHESPISVEPSGEIILRSPSPLRVWSLSAFADLRALNRESLYQMDQASLERALRAGFDLRDIEGFLVNQSGSALPPELAGRIRGWTQKVRRVRLSRAIQLLPDDPADMAELQELLNESGFESLPAGEGLVVLGRNDEERADTERALLEGLRSAGFTPQGLLNDAPATSRPSRDTDRMQRPKPKPKHS